jgi:hypothetical protein
LCWSTTIPCQPTSQILRSSRYVRQTW